MERMTAVERQDALNVILAEGRDGITEREADRLLLAAVRIAGKLHRIYERQCNGHQTWDGKHDEAAAQRDEADEEKAEAQLRQLFAQAGLGLYLNADPRGNPVGIHTPKTGRYNTMGGRECGWRL